MGDKVWFATKNDTVTPAASSGFNGFPFVVPKFPRRDIPGIIFNYEYNYYYDYYEKYYEMWGNSIGYGTKYNLGPMTLEQAVAFYWRPKHFWLQNTNIGGVDVSQIQKYHSAKTEKDLCAQYGSHASSAIEDEDNQYWFHGSTSYQGIAVNEENTSEYWGALSFGFNHKRGGSERGPTHINSSPLFYGYDYELEQTEIQVEVNFCGYSIQTYAYKSEYTGIWGIHSDFQVSPFIAVEYWPYSNSEGLPVWDTFSGKQLRDPAS